MGRHGTFLLHGGSVMMPTLNLVEGVLAMGRRYQEVGRHREAAAVFTRLSHFRYLPADAAEETQARLAEIHLKRRKYKHARRHLTAALRYQPDNARYHYLLATALCAEDGADLRLAGEHFSRVLQLDPAHVKCRADYGHLLLRLGQTDEGLARLREAAHQAPEDVEILGKLVKGLRLSGRSDEARSVLDLAMFRNARSPRFRKLWNEFRFQQARRRRDAERMQQATAEADGEQPVLLPFIRVVNDTPQSSDCPTILSREDSAASARSLRFPRRSEQRNVQ
jgi:tetratricopeptide (TPR) repeat protein